IGDHAYYLHYETCINPITDASKPGIMSVSAGQDPSFYDPLGRMMMTANGFYQLTMCVKDIAKKHCNSRLVVCHEGGYSAPYVPFCSLKIIEGLSNIDSGVEDPFASSFAEFPINEVRDIEKEAINHIIELQSNYWNITT